MKILITTDWYYPIVNGVVTSVVNLKKQLEKRGNEVKILTLSSNHRSYVEGDVTYLASINAEKIYNNARIAVSYVNSYITDLEKWKPDIVHSQCEFSTYIIAKRICSKVDAPLLHTYHTVYEDYTHYFFPSKRLGKSVVSYLTKLAVRKTSAVIVPTEKVKKLLDEYGVKKDMIVLPTGVEIEKFKAVYEVEDWILDKKQELNIPLDKNVLLFAGRVAKEKNIQEILHCLKEDNGNENVLVIVGDGPYMPEIKELTKELELSEKVFFTGMVKPEEMPIYYRLGDIFVSASTSETQGLTYIEALSAGLPLLCKKDPCLDEVVEEGINGWTFEDKEDFLAKIKLYEESKVDHRELQDNAFKSADKFSAEKFAENAEEVYTAIIASKPRKKRRKWHIKKWKKIMRMQKSRQINFRIIKKSKTNDDQKIV